jgi:non-ribosomal peptide synthetase component E (peptide arylation enzyme)
VCEDDEIAVVDDDGREVPDGEAGELITRGPYTIRGYYRAPEKNSEAFTPTASTAWATSCANGAATSRPRAGART